MLKSTLVWQFEGTNPSNGLCYDTAWHVILSSSRTSVRVKLGLFNVKIRNDNRRYICRLTYQLNKTYFVILCRMYL